MKLFTKQKTLKGEEHLEWVASERIITETLYCWVVLQHIQCVNANGQVYPGTPRTIVRPKPLLPRYFKKINGEDFVLSVFMGALAGSITGRLWAGVGVFLLFLIISSFRPEPSRS